MATRFASPSTSPSTPTWAYVVGAWTLFGLLHGIVWTAARDESLRAAHWTFPTSFVVAWGWALLTPVIFRLTRIVAPARVGWGRSIVAHACVVIASAAAMTAMRRAAIAFFSGTSPEPFLPFFFYWFDVWLIIYCTLVVIGHAFAVRRRYVDRTVRAHLLEAELARAQLQYLELQLQPHFLFNALNAIQELAHEAPRSAERMLRRLHALLSISLERSGRDEVTLGEEIAALEPYLDIQRTRFSDWLDVRVSVAPSLRRAMVPHLILQPLVENAIRHGLSVRPAPGQVHVIARRSGDRLILRVEDDGVGLKRSEQGGREGIGLRNASERLRQLYGTAHRFELRDARSGGVVVELEIPFREGSDLPPAPTPTTGRGASIAPFNVEEMASWRTGEYSTALGANEPLGEIADTPTPVPHPVAAEGASAEWQPSGSFRAARRTQPPLASPATLSGELSPAPGLTPRAWFGIVALWLVLALFWTNQMVLFTSVNRDMGVAPVSEIARLQVATSVIWIALSPVVFWLARRFRMDSTNWKRRLPVHVAMGVASGIIHTGTMRLVGLLELPVLSSGNLNPLTGDFFVYFALLAWSHARDFVAWYRTRELEGARLAARIAGSRFQALRVQLRPQFLLSTLELLADLVHHDVPRAERLITRLADTLRLTLDLGRESTTSIKQELDLLRICLETHRIGIRPGIRLVTHVPSSALALRIPSRLVCTMVDDLLVSDALNPRAPLTVRVEVERGSDVTRIRLRGETAWGTGADGSVSMGGGSGAGGGTAGGRNDPHAWWRTKSVAEAAVADAGALVSVTFPDRATAVLVVADQPAAAQHHPPAELAGAVA